MSIFGRSRLRCLLGTLAWTIVGLLSAAPLSAADAFYEIPIDKLKITAGELPGPAEEIDWRHWQRNRMMIPYAVLEGEGETYLGSNVGRRNVLGIAPPQRVPVNGNERVDAPNRSAIAVRALAGRPVTGSIYLPNADFTGMTRVKFAIPAKAATAEARKNFYLTKEEYYRGLVARNIPGGAWFRYQANEARRTLTGKSVDEPLDTRQPRRPRVSQLEDTFQIFSGGRAVSENLQLDRLIRPTKLDEPTVDISTLEGITVAEMDWTKLTAGLKPDTDPLAAFIPADQHALFFPSFRALVRMMDEAARDGTPFLHLVQQRAEDARSRERYERQLCLSVDAVSRLLGNRVVDGVAFTGSDPYLRTGTDVAVLFDAKSPTILTGFLASKQAAAVQTHPGCQQVTGTAGKIAYSGVVAPDRTICSYLAAVGDVVIVTNSLAQLDRLDEVLSEESESIASLPEYRFFRDRYQRSNPEETAFLIVSDATIRRWCGPKWRIASSRRTRAAAIMAQQQAMHLDRLVQGTAEEQPLETNLYVPNFGPLRLTESGIASATYGTLDFETPISELYVATVTEAEAASYRRWRDGYQRYWRQFFDPIAVSFSVRDEKIAADVTVMPLIEQTDYREFIAVSTGAAIGPDAADRHAGSLLHWAMAVNVKSEPVREANNLLANIVPALKVNPLGWLGQSIAVYADEDPFWAELAKAEDAEKFLEEEYYRLPIAFHAEVSSSLKLAVFLTGLRGFAEQSAPGLVTWETLTHKDQPYVKISPTEEARRQEGDVAEKLALYYAATPRALIVTLNEDVLKRALDRQAARKQAEGENKPPADEAKPWLGSSMVLAIDGKALGLFEKLAGDDYQALMQARSWANLPILNEWKRRYPKQDPVKLHADHWQTTLRCPGGGEYVWNEEFQTMQSTAYGHPGQPKTGPRFPLLLESAKSVNFGVTFENKGLRAKVALERTPAK